MHVRTRVRRFRSRSHEVLFVAPREMSRAFAVLRDGLNVHVGTGPMARAILLTWLPDARY